MTRWPVALLFTCVVFVTGNSPRAEDAAAQKPVEFNRDIRPILADKCFACHGPDSNKREAELRLDSEEGAWGPRDGVAVLVAGKPEESELFRRLTAEDPDERMPPASSQKAVSPEQIELIRRWIEQGGKYQPHWALIPPRQTNPPAAAAAWKENPIDAFVAAAREPRNLPAAPDADRRTLARRLHFDLLGLPPSPEVVEEFVSSSSPHAYADLVERLLASPHFGERMAVYWLDVVRYADSGGYHSDNERELSPYRDYVIRAFNENLPFDQFTVEQIAGDLLPNATTQQRIASGYNRLLQTTEEGGAQPKEYSAKYQADRVRNTGVAWLGLTLGCSECHDHKYDPITARDFYSFAAFFADIQEKPVGRQDQIGLPTPEQEVEVAKLDSQLQQAQREFELDRPELQAGQAKWEEQARAEMEAGKFAWSVLQPDKLEAQAETTLKIQPDKSVLASGKNPPQETYTVTLTLPDTPTTGLRLEVLTHESHTLKSLSRANGNVVVTEIEALARQGDEKEPTAVTIREVLADFSQDGFPVTNVIDGKKETGWALAGHEKVADHEAVLIFDRPLAPGSTLVLKLHHESEYKQHQMGRFRLSATHAERPALPPGGLLPDDVLAALKVERADRTSEQQQTLVRHYRTLAPELADLRRSMAGLQNRRQELEQAFPKTLISVSTTPRTVRLLPRGNWLDDSGDIMRPATPEVLPGRWTGEGQSARLELARWLVARENPLTARVFVNRLWKLYFGQGIVKTLDDFGTQGAAPTHPELLDWLAIRFMDQGWDVKYLIRMMVTSRTYQQSSTVSRPLRDRDPTNQWLARQASFRLDAEMVRDNALAISGLMTWQIGGRSVKPYQPAGYWRFLNFPTREWANDAGANQYRRGLYTHWQRTFLHPSLLAFDAPSREECTVDRPRSNTPLQALVLLNDPTYVEAARVLAARVVRQGGANREERLQFAFQQALNRDPTDKEREVLTAMFERHREQYAKDQATAEAALKVGEAPPPADEKQVEVAAWTSVTRVILNLHETITRY